VKRWRDPNASILALSNHTTHGKRKILARKNLPACRSRPDNGNNNHMPPAIILRSDEAKGGQTECHFLHAWYQNFCDEIAAFKIP
jgi:hypothetical protein